MKMSASKMNASVGAVITSIAFVGFSFAANAAIAGSPLVATEDLESTMDVVDTKDDVAGAKEIEVNEAKESVIAGKESAAADKDNIQQEVKSGAQGPDGAA
jgi:hypothetical protein